MKAVFTQAVVGAWDDIVQHTGRAGGGSSGGTRLLQRLRKQLPHSTRTPPSPPLLCMYGSMCALVEQYFFPDFPAQSFTRALRQLCYSILKDFFFFSKFHVCRFLQIEINAIWIRRLYVIWISLRGIVPLVLLFSISFKKREKHNSNVCRLSLIKMIDWMSNHSAPTQPLLSPLSLSIAQKEVMQLLPCCCWLLEIASWFW